MENYNSSKTLKAGIWYTFSSFLSKGIVFLSASIFARLLTKTEYGKYSNFATWQNLLLIIVTFELYSTIARARYDYEYEMDQYISSITLLGSIITFVYYIIVIMFMPFFCDLFALEPIYIHIMFLYMLVAPALQIYQAKCRIYMQYKSATIITVFSSIGSVLLAVIITIALKDKLFARIIGQQSALFVVNLIIYVWIIYKGKAFDKKYFKYALGIAVPLIPHIIAGNLLGSSDKIAIQKLCGDEELAYYSLVFNCSLLVNVFWSSLNQAMVPWLFSKLSEQRYKEIKNISKYYILIFMYIAVGIMFFIPEIVLIFGGKEYSDAKYIMAPIIMGSCFQFAYSMYVNIEMYEKKTILVSMGTLGAAILNMILNYIFIKDYGYSAAAYTTMSCYAVLALFHYIIIRYMKMNFIYDNKFNLMVLIIVLCITCFMNIVYNNEIIRMIIVIIYGGVTVIISLKNKNKVKAIIQMIIH